MSAAIVAGVVVGGAGMIGSSIAAGKAADAQRDGNKQAAASNQANLDFQREQYDKQMEDIGALEDIFGPVRENLGNYYKNMSPERYQMIGKENLEKQYQRSNDQLDAVFSNNGMYNSGQAMSARVALEEQREVSMGANQQNAMNQYQQEQTNWLKFGTADMNQQKAHAAGQAGNVGNAFGQSANSFQNGGNAMAQIGMQRAQGWGQFGSGGLQMAGYAMGRGTAFGGQTQLAPRAPSGNQSNYESAPGFIGPQRS